MIGSILITLVMAAAPADKVLASWDFVNGLQGWSTHGTAKVGHESNAMVIETDGRDPILLSPPVSFAPEDGDLLEVRMSATRNGDIQWFYRTTAEGPYGGFRPDAQRLVPVGGREKVQMYRAAMLWGGAEPIIGLRLDLPEGGPRTYRIEAVRVVRPAVRSLSAYPWRSEQRLPLAPPRIDIATQMPPTTKTVPSDFTVAMWYFAA